MYTTRRQEDSPQMRVGAIALDDVRATVEAREPFIRALLPEDDRFDRLSREAEALVHRYPDPSARPPLFGLLFGVKDIFHVDGWPTHAGSRLPASALTGSEAESVARLRSAGALMLGKTVTTEFAYFTPGPTRNPHSFQHTPGGSSSGSAAAVAAGYCPLALGTQTIGSIIRPAAFCGVVGLKPTFGRISTRGVIPCAPSFDHVGVVAVDVATAGRAARALYARWTDDRPRAARPVLGVPVGPYLECADAETCVWFERVRRTLDDAGYGTREVAIMRDFDRVRARHQAMLAAEAARVHAAWFAEYSHLYGSQMADLIGRGQSISNAELERARAEQAAFRAHIIDAMHESRIDLWICPSTIGPAPIGLESTGDPVMNLPWTQAGLPAVSLPAGQMRGLPMGLQVVAGWNDDEFLLACASDLERLTRRLYRSEAVPGRGYP